MKIIENSLLNTSLRAEEVLDNPYQKQTSAWSLYSQKMSVCLSFISEGSSRACLPNVSEKAYWITTFKRGITGKSWSLSDFKALYEKFCLNTEDENNTEIQKTKIKNKKLEHLSVLPYCLFPQYPAPTSRGRWKCAESTLWEISKCGRGNDGDTRKEEVLMKHQGSLSFELIKSCTETDEGSLEGEKGRRQAQNAWL